MSAEAQTAAGDLWSPLSERGELSWLRLPGKRGPRCRLSSHSLPLAGATRNCPAGQPASARRLRPAVPMATAGLVQGSPPTGSSASPPPPHGRMGVLGSERCALSCQEQLKVAFSDRPRPSTERLKPGTLRVSLPGFQSQLHFLAVRP